MNFKAFRKEKLVFDIDDRPNLLTAIVTRLEALGFEMSRTTSNPRNVSTNWQDHDIHCGLCHAKHPEFADHRLTTLEDLYDIERWYESPPELSLFVNGTKVDLSDETVEAIQEAMDR